MPKTPVSRLVGSAPRSSRETLALISTAPSARSLRDSRLSSIAGEADSDLRQWRLFWISSPGGWRPDVPPRDLFATQPRTPADRAARRPYRDGQESHAVRGQIARGARVRSRSRRPPSRIGPGDFSGQCQLSQMMFASRLAIALATWILRGLNAPERKRRFPRFASMDPGRAGSNGNLYAHFHYAPGRNGEDVTRIGRVATQ
jgi:hypothetical protein